jgi:hypothetical protein
MSGSPARADEPVSGDVFTAPIYKGRLGIYSALFRWVPINSAKPPSALSICKISLMQILRTARAVTFWSGTAARKAEPREPQRTAGESQGGPGRPNVAIFY